ncbi:MAG: FtsQ-type POTRA domain-containing protein [Myxococcales bacterium]|nr:FtsQ-type POTRA domain-containing protein [Myxococcales bacterium]
MASTETRKARKVNRRRKPASEPAPERPNRRQQMREALGRLGKRLAFLKRPALWGGRVLLLAAVYAGTVAATRLIERHVRTSAAFATTEIVVDGHSRLEREEVLGAAGLALGQNAFEVGPEDAANALEAHPWVLEAKVQRRLPGNFRIELEEREAVALLVLEQTFLVGDDGSVFKPLEPGDPIDLPVVTGVDAERFRGDLKFRRALLVSVVALLHDYRDAGLWRREPIAEIHVEDSAHLSLYVGEDALLVRLGARPFREKLRRLRGILDEMKRDKARPAYVFLDNRRRPDRVTVRLR